VVATAGTKIMSRPARVDVTGHAKLAKVRPASSHRLQRGDCAKPAVLVDHCYWIADLAHPGGAGL
jgi:hypothetical protein